MFARTHVARALGAPLLLAASLGGCDPAPGPAPNVGVPPSTAGATQGPHEDPVEKQVARLRQPETRAGAVSRLARLFEEAMERDEQSLEGPTVERLLDRIVSPLNEACVAGGLDRTTTSALLGLLHDARRPEGGPCLVKALRDYVPDSTEEDVRWAARAVRVMRLRSAAGPLFEVFTKMKPSRPKAGAVYRDVYDAMLVLSDPSWEPALIANLDRPVTDWRSRESQIDEVQWSTVTSAKLLGELRSEKAVPALLRVMLTPDKADAHMTCVLALLKAGKPASAAAIALLEGKDKEMVRYSEAEAARGYGQSITADQKKEAAGAHVATAALVLATIGREESRAPLLAAIKSAGDVARAIIARELPKVPRSADTVKAFQAVFEKTPLSLTLPPAGQNALESLLDVAPTFFDASLVPWLIKVAGTVKGDEEDVAAFKETALIAMMKMMRADQLAAVEKFAAGKTLGADGEPSTVGKALERELSQSRALLQACGDKVECYMDRLADPTSQDDKTLFTGIKAMYMVGALGSPAVKGKLVARMPGLKNAALRGLAASVIDFHSPKGDAETAGELQRIVDAVEATKDPALMATQSHFRYTIHRLQARAQ